MTFGCSCNMLKSASFFSCTFLMNALLISGVLSVPFNTGKVDRKDMVKLENGSTNVHPNNDDDISSLSSNERNKRNIFSNNFEQCLIDIKEAVERQNESPLDFVARKFGHAVASKIQNIVNPQEDDFLTSYCRSAKTLVNTVQNVVNNNNGGSTFENNLDRSANEIGSKFSEVVNSKWFKIGLGILIGVALFAILVKCCKRCCNNRQPEIKKSWRNGPNYEIVGNLQQV